MTQQDDRPTPAPNRFQEQFGGVKGMVDSGLPVVVFVLVNALRGLHWAIWAAVAAGLAVLVLRLVRREPVQFAVGGFLSVAFAAFLAYKLGKAKGFFLPGIVTNGAYFLAFASSLLVRWPLVGVVWTYLDSGTHGWRHQPSLRRGYTQATVLWTAMYAAKTVVQGLLYLHNQPGWLAVAKFAMGYPLFAVVVATTLWLVRRAKEQIAPESEAAPTDGQPIESAPSGPQAPPGVNPRS